jgi:hypothetical protein
MGPMFAMANATGVYIVFGFGGATTTERFHKTTHGFGNGMSNPTSGSIFTVGSETYIEYVSWIGEVMRQYQNETSIAMWDVFNEPDGDHNYFNYWQHLADPGGSFKSWLDNITADAVAEDHHHLIHIGIAGQGSFVLPILKNNADVLGSHLYNHVENDYYLNIASTTYHSLGKPVFYGEAGLDDSSNSYWPWLETEFVKYQWSRCWMTLLNYPGYPISQSVMDSIPAPPHSYTPPPVVNTPLSPPLNAAASGGVKSVSLTWSTPFLTVGPSSPPIASTWRPMGAPRAC